MSLHQPHPPEPRVALDIVTPTRNRFRELVEQARRLALQLSDLDRWIIVDDASGVDFNIHDLVSVLGSAKQLTFTALSYDRRGWVGTVNMARHAGCSLARRGSWIVELDDHDWLHPGALERIRTAILEGASCIYGDVQLTSARGPGEIFRKPDYRPWLLRDEMCPTAGVRAYPAGLYHLVGGYRWDGEVKVHGCEFPAGDYGLFMRMEEVLDGTGFKRVPEVLCDQPKVPDGISMRNVDAQEKMARALRREAHAGTLLGMKVTSWELEPVAVSEDTAAH